MEKLLQTLSTNQIEMISYFASEIFCIFGIIINFFAFLFLRKIKNIKQFCDLTTFGLFILSSLASFGIFISNKLTFGSIGFSFFGGDISFCCNYMLSKSLIYLFFGLFILCTYKLTKKARFSAGIINSCLLITALISSMLIQIENGILAFICLDICSFFIYKFASNMRLRKYETYSVDFVLMSASASILFYSFYLLSFGIKEDLQLEIIQVCIACTILFKAGIFPIYNYSLNRHTKNNLPYSILLFGFLPYLGVIAFIKFIQGIDFSNKVFFITLSLFALFCAFSFAINAFRAKNLTKFLANITYTSCAFYIISALCLQDMKLITDTIFISAFITFALYSMFAILKINLKSDKINILSLKGLFIKNKNFCIIFSILILINCNIIPTSFFINNIDLLKGIYEFDKIGSYFVISFLFFELLIILNSFNIIKSCYDTKKLTKTNPKLKKRTTPNYVVPYLVIFIVIISMFL